MMGNSDRIMNKIILKIQKLMIHKYTIQLNYNYELKIFLILYIPGQTPDLTLKLMKTERNTILRKVYEAMLIYEYKPSINDKEECKVLERFLVRSCN